MIVSCYCAWVVLSVSRIAPVQYYSLVQSSSLVDDGLRIIAHNISSRLGGAPPPLTEPSGAADKGCASTAWYPNRPGSGRQKRRAGHNTLTTCTSFAEGQSTNNLHLAQTYL
eukprot:gene9033-biopygen4237